MGENGRAFSRACVRVTVSLFRNLMSFSRFGFFLKFLCTADAAANKPPLCAYSRGEALEEEVIKIHRRYFDQISAMFDRHKAQAGYPKHKLVLQP